MQVMYMDIHTSRHLKEELAWATDKRLWVIGDIMFFKVVMKLKN